MSVYGCRDEQPESAPLLFSKFQLIVHSHCSSGIVLDCSSENPLYSSDAVRQSLLSVVGHLAAELTDTSFHRAGVGSASERRARRVRIRLQRTSFTVSISFYWKKPAQQQHSSRPLNVLIHSLCVCVIAMNRVCGGCIDCAFPRMHYSAKLPTTHCHKL